MRERRSIYLFSATLLASTALISPAHAQSVSSNPERFLQVDENGVDLVTDTYVQPFGEGKIGSGEGTVSITRGTWGPDQWSGLIYRLGGTTMVVQLGPVADTFTSTDGVTWVPTKANGATLAKTSNSGEWLYTAADGTKIIYHTIINTDSSGLVTQPYQVNGPGCAGADANTCGIPISITRPNGLVFHLNWDFDETCSPANSFPCQNATAYFRFKGVTSSAGYGFARNYSTDDPGAFSAPQSTWFIRTGVTFSDGTTVTYGAPSSGVSTITDTLGRVWTFTSAADGSTHIQRPGSTTDNIIIGDNTTGGTVTFVTKDGVKTTYAHTVVGTTSTIVKTDPLGHAKTIVADMTLGRVTAITDENAHKTSYTYDANGRLTKVTQPEGNGTQYAYDARGNLTTTTVIAKDGVTKLTTSASFDATCSNTVKCNEPNSATDAKGNVTTYTYDATHGGVLTATPPLPAAGGVQPQTRYSYTQITSAQGDVVYKLTAVSQCQATASCAGTADEAKTTATYNAQLLPATITRTSGAGGPTATTTVTYDARGNLNTVDGPLTGDTTKYRYDAGDQLLGVTSPDPDGTGAMIPRAIRLTYRPDGQVSKEELGTVADQTDAAWASFSPKETVAITFDANSRQVQQKLSSATTAYALTQTDYDALGRTNCTAVRLSPAAAVPASACTVGTTGDQISQLVYDPASQVTARKVGVGSTAATTERTLAYNPNGTMASLTDGNGNVTSYSYDGFDRLTKTTYPVPAAGGTATFEQFAYDANSNVTSHALRDGTAIGFTYDNLNRLTLKNRPGTELDVTYAYDNLGRLKSATETGNSLSFTYDALSRNLTEVGPQGTVTSTYDLAGNRTSIAYPGTPALTIAYTYLTTGEVSTIKDGATALATYAYDNLGNRTSATLGNGVVQSYGYDPVSRLTTLTHNLAGTTNDLTIGGSTTPITYNAASQITSAPRSNSVYSWTGAAAVNRAYGINGLNQYTSAGTATFGYDAKGNLTSDGTNSFAYSSENLLTSATVAGVATTLSYDPWMRLSSVAGSTTTKFAYDGLNILGDYDGANALQHRYVFGPGMDQPIAEYSSTGVRTYLSADERGSIVARSDAAGNLANANTYDEYGIPGSANAGLFEYTGQAWISQLGMYYNKARFYSPTLGRFMQTDPIGADDNANLYAYVHNDPVNLVDPSGLTPCDGTEAVCGHCTGGTVAVTANTSSGIMCVPASDGGKEENQVGGGGFGPGIGTAESPTSPPDPPQPKPPCGGASDLAESAKYVLDFTGTAADLGAVTVAAAGLFAAPAPPLAAGLETAAFVLKGISVSANALSAGISFVQGNYYSFAGSALAATIGLKGDAGIEAFSKLYGSAVKGGKAEIGATAASQAIARGLVCPK